MTNATLSLNTDSIHHQVRKAVGELYSGAENVRLVAAALGDSVGQLLATAGPEELRQVAAIVKTHTTGVLASAAGLASKADRLECIADIRDACEPPPSAADEG
ncbi:MAG TPA: hypothetical protein VG937_00035 [Polyangiaceae bacterium]|nr:hypothetical protein [Polyangiaceae bacterium]